MAWPPVNHRDVQDEIDRKQNKSSLGGDIVANATVRGELVPFWKAGEAVAAGVIRVAPTGETIKRNAAGTAGLAYDATEAAAWTVTAPAPHTHPVAQVSDSTAVGRAVVTAADAPAARTAIGAGTSSLVLGTTAGTAKAGDYQPVVANISDFNAGVRAVMPAIRTVTAAATLALADDVVRVDSASALAVTVPTNATVAFPIGYVAQVRRVGAGAVDIAAATGVTINGKLTGVPQHGSYALMKVGTDVWDVEGGV